MQAFKNQLLYGLGIAFLSLAAVRHRIWGYRRPTAFSSSDHAQATAHVAAIVGNWNDTLASLGTHPGGFRGLDVLELGPGATLGTGVLLRSSGARSYLAVDVNSLAKGTSPTFYRMLADAPLPACCDPDVVRAIATSLAHGQDAGVAYSTDPDFNIVRAVQGRKFDVVVSNAAFEHFCDIDAVLADLAAVMRPSSVFIAMVDFQTHSRWVRHMDPNSIYRFAPAIYHALTFPGQPNRCRPDDYLKALTRHNWSDAQVRPVDRADPNYLAQSQHSWASAYREKRACMDVLTGIITARRLDQEEWAAR